MSNLLLLVTSYTNVSIQLSAQPHTANIMVVDSWSS